VRAALDALSFALFANGWEEALSPSVTQRLTGQSWVSRGHPPDMSQEPLPQIAGGLPAKSRCIMMITGYL